MRRERSASSITGSSSVRAVRPLTVGVLGTAALAAVAGGAWLAADQNDAVTRVTIDERTGGYRGVRFGSSAQDVIRHFGEPDREPGFAPSGESPARVGVPQSIPGTGGLLKYEDVVFLAASGRGVYAIMVTDAGATTKRGVAIGDALKEAREKYELECMRVAGGESPLGGQEFYPSCGADVGGGVRIWFGRDPITSITVVSRRYARP